MAKKKTQDKKTQAKKSKTKKPQAKKKSSTTKRAAKQKAISPQEEKMDIIGSYLEEVFHLVGHSIAEGTEAETPWKEIMSAMIAVHNQQDENVGHHIRGITFECECASNDHRLVAKDYLHDCHS